MKRDNISHIPFINSITDFFRVYGLGIPLHKEIMCMRLEDQPDEKLTHMPLSRVNFYRVLLFTKANLHFYRGEEKVNAIRNCLCFSYPGKLESWTRSGRLHGYVVYFTSSFSELDVTRATYDQDYPFFNFESEPLIPLTKDETLELSSFMEEMIAEMYSTAEDKLELIRKMLLVYLHKVRRVYNKNVNALPGDIKASKVLFNLFRKAIDTSLYQLYEKKKRTHPTVSSVANELSVSANYLNGVVKKLTGKTASSHIQDKLVLEAKSFLIHTNLQAAEIATRLGYQHVSYFNRFFKKATGLSPLMFRKQFTK